MDCSSSEEHHKITKLIKVVSEKNWQKTTGFQSALEAETISCLRTRADGTKSTSPEPEKPIKPVFAKPKGFNNAN